MVLLGMWQTAAVRADHWSWRASEEGFSHQQMLLGDNTRASFNLGLPRVIKDVLVSHLPCSLGVRVRHPAPEMRDCWGG